MNSKFFLQLSGIILAYSLLNFQAIRSAGAEHVAISNTEALINAASNGEYDAVVLALTGQSVINGQDSDGLTALMAAASNGHARIVELLLQQPTIDLNIKTKIGWTALIFAIVNGHSGIMQTLLNRPDIDITVADTSHQTCIEYVMLNEQKAKMVPLLTKRIDELIKNAILNGRMDKAQILHLLLVEKILKNEDTIIHWAARTGDLNIIKTLCENEPDFITSSIQKNIYGEAPLTISQTTNRDMYFWFLDKQLESSIMAGTIVEAQILHSKIDAQYLQTGDTLVHWAVRKGDFNILKTLFTKAPALIKLIGRPNALGEMPLVMGENDFEMRLFLLNQTVESHILLGEIDKAQELQIDIEETELHNEDTFLHWAVRNGNFNILKIVFTALPSLINLIDKKNKFGETPLTLAYANPQIYGYLLVIANGSKQSIESSAENFLKKIKMVELIARQMQSGAITLENLKPKEADKHLCSVCSKESHGQRCSRCPTRYYCSIACQKKDWPTHKHVCGKKN